MLAWRLAVSCSQGAVGEKTTAEPIHVKRVDGWAGDGKPGAGDRKTGDGGHEDGDTPSRAWGNFGAYPRSNHFLGQIPSRGKVVDLIGIKLLPRSPASFRVCFAFDQLPKNLTSAHGIDAATTHQELHRAH